MTDRGPLAPLAGVPGLPGALARAALAALGQTAGVVLLAAGLAHAVARAAGQTDGPLAGPLLVATAGVALRAAAGALGELTAARDARRAEDGLRRRVLERLAGSPAAVAAAGGPGPAAVLATTRLADLGPGLAAYLPALAQTLVVPPVLLAVLAATDLLSAVLVAVTLPLVPVFMVLVGTATRDGTTAAARALDRIAGHVAELVRGLPVLVGLGRAADQAAALAELGEASRSRTLATLRLAFLSALVLELIATLAVALVAVTVGLRLVHGELGLAVGLTALLLAPEAFAPLRALGSAHHANEDAALAAAEARAVLA
ncbi:MAG TPA: ABC transporter transmembrane domain-containing protein, partial [Geodermatophilus sp.]|nr:ABC transporter transmembrane domain-containing protein [Geodermatophilus sp.]